MNTTNLIPESIVGLSVKYRLKCWKYPNLSFRYITQLENCIMFFFCANLIRSQWTFDTVGGYNVVMHLFNSSYLLYPNNISTLRLQSTIAPISSLLPDSTMIITLVGRINILFFSIMLSLFRLTVDVNRADRSAYISDCASQLTTYLRKLLYLEQSSEFCRLQAVRVYISFSIFSMQ